VVHSTQGDRDGGTAGGRLPATDEVASRVDGLLADLRPEEQAVLTSGADMWHGERVPRIGVRALKVSDGPAGVRGERFVGTRSACVPCGSALGATWDPTLVAEVGALLGREARSKGVHLLLAPTVNLHRTPLAGRNFECYSEDPHLSAAIAVGFIDGVQSTGVGACVKHLVANDSEFERHTISSEVDERTLRELSLVPFEAAVRDAGVAAVMSAYNRLNGTYCAEHAWLLTTVLREEWGFDGLVVSDWWGTMSPASAGAGLDLEMPGPAVHLGATSAGRIVEGTLDPAVVAEQARHVLELAARTGALDAEEAPESSAELPGTRALLRRAAAASAVLLRNELVDGAPVLPLDPDSLRTLAVVGPNATDTALLGGGSAWVNAHHQDSLVEGIRRRLGPDVEVLVERGVDASLTCPPVPGRMLRPSDGSGGPHGLTVEYFANRTLEGEPVHVEVCSTGRLSWIDDDTVPSAGFSARLTATLIVDEDGPHTFGLTTAGTGRLWLDGELLCDNTDDPVPGSSFFGMGTEEVRSTVELLAGTEHELRCEYVSYRDLAIGGVQVGLLRPVPEDGIARAADAASRADAAVVVVGLNADWETEGHDRSSTELPGGQGELIRAVVAANPRTVVVVNAGAVVDLDDVVNAPGVLWIWYPGQEAADGVTDLLVGDVAPSGRLPTSFARRCEDHPAFATYPGADGVVRYDEGLSLGYRGLDATGVEPVFCFGHGLTYGSLDWGEVTLSTTSAAIDDLADEPVTVRLPLHNPGDRPLREVVQVYVSDVESSLECPPLELRGFVAVDVPPGGSAEALVELGPRAFAHWDPTAGDWVVEPGAFRVSASRSSRMHHAWLSLDLH
jgi:beta-glucosidase